MTYLLSCDYERLVVPKQFSGKRFGSIILITDDLWQVFQFRFTAGKE
jgi:hypothetical protein